MSKSSGSVRGRLGCYVMGMFLGACVIGGFILGGSICKCLILGQTEFIMVKDWKGEHMVYETLCK